MIAKPKAKLDVPTICSKLVVLGRWRRQTMKRQRHINQPSVQCYISELSCQYKQRTGKDPEMSMEQMYKKAGKCRKIILKTVQANWPELLALTKDMNDKTIKAFVKRLNSESEGELDQDELNASVSQCYSIMSELQSLTVLDNGRKSIEKRMAELASQLPVVDWWCSHAGCNVLGLANIVSETGDLSTYANPDKVKKRMGLAPFRGKAMSTWRMSGGLNAEEWIEAGYNPTRRSVMYNIGECIVKAGSRSGVKDFQEVLHERKKLEAKKARENGLIPASTTKATVDNWLKNGLPKLTVVKKFDKSKHMAASHINNRALRYMQQQILIQLWAEWNDK